MKKDLIVEIVRTRQLMNILNEQIPVTLTDDLAKGLMKRFSKYGGIISDDIELLASIAAGRRAASQDEIIDIISRLVSRDKQIEEYMMKKIIQNFNVPTQNFLAKFKTKIENFKKTGGTYEQALRNIDQNIRAVSNGRPVFEVPAKLPQIRDYVKRDLERYAYEVYHPTLAKSEKFLSKQYGKFKEGSKLAGEAKSGALLTVRSIMKTITPQRIEKLFPTYFKRLNPEERKIMWNWLKWGLPDVPNFMKARKEWGLAGAAGNVSRQILRKTLWLMGALTIFQFIRDYIGDLIKPGEEYKDWNKLAVFFHRLVRAIDAPAFGLTSPAGWLMGLIGTTFYNSLTGSDKAAWETFKDYILGEDEGNIPKPPENVRRFIDNLRGGIDTLTNTAQQRLDTLTSGQDTNIQDVLPDTALAIPSVTDTSSQEQSSQNTTLSDEEIRELLGEWMMTKEGGWKPGSINDEDKTEKFMKNEGNNKWSYISPETNPDGSPKVYYFQFDPLRRTFKHL